MQDHTVHIFDMVLTSDNGQPSIALFVQDSATPTLLVDVESVKLHV